MPVPFPIIPYDPFFLGGGIEVPLPEPNEELREQLYTRDDGSHVLHYTHFSVAMHRERGTAIYSACNIDGKHRVMGIKRAKKWLFDDRAGGIELGPEAYSEAWNRGHLTRREDVIWGEPDEARAANKSTFFYTNAAPQHGNFNQDEWLGLEDWVLEWADRDQYRLCVITGPVLKRNDRRLSEGDPALRRVIRDEEDILVPAAYWKIMALRDVDTGQLAVAAFAMRQTDMWDDKDGRTMLRLTVHQVTVEAIEEWTDLSFGALRDADALQIQEAAERFARSAEGDAIWPVIRSAEDIVIPRGSGADDEERSAGAAAPRRKKSGCGCQGESDDVQAAIASLSDDVARLTQLVARLGTERAAPHDGDDVRSLASGGEEAAPAPPPAAEADLSDEERVARVLSRIRITSPSDRTVSAFVDLTRIVGGEDVEPGEYPATCCLGSWDKFSCTGVLVHPRVVVSAAHCGSKLVYAYFGDLIPTKGGEGKTVKIRNAIVHQQYDKTKKVRNDISVMILAEDAGIAPVRIATTAEIAAMESVQLVGFGYNDPMKPVGFGQKRKVVVPVGAVRRAADEDMKVLEQTFGFSSPYEFVAGRKALGRDSCNGDSGGPAFILTGGLRVAGVTSRATKEAKVNCGDGGIYVRLDAYRDWIAETAKKAGITDFPA